MDTGQYFGVYFYGCSDIERLRLRPTHRVISFDDIKSQHFGNYAKCTDSKRLIYSMK